MVGVGKDTLLSYTPMTLHAQPNGKVTASREDGQVLSVQPDGSHEWRPAGTAAAYELATVRGDKLIYNYRDAGGVLRVHVVPYISDLPDFA